MLEFSCIISKASFQMTKSAVENITHQTVVTQTPVVFFTCETQKRSPFWDVQQTNVHHFWLKTMSFYGVYATRLVNMRMFTRTGW